MEDTLFCPICQTRLRTIRLNNTFVSAINKTSTFYERTCVGLNHSLMFYTDKKTKTIDFIKLSLDSKYSKFLKVNFITKTCEIACFKKSEEKIISVPKMLDLDFPNLTQLKEKISIYVTLS